MKLDENFQAEPLVYHLFQNHGSENVPKEIVMDSVEMVQDQGESLKISEDNEKEAKEIHIEEGNNN